MTNDEEKQPQEETTEAQAAPQTWTSVAVQGFFTGLVSGGGYILQDFTTGGWSKFGYALILGGFIALMYPLSLRKAVLGLPVYVAANLIPIGIAALLVR